MPLFLRHKLLYIHIPKCGGTSVNEGLRDSGDAPFLFVSNGSVMLNGHTPQHATWQEFINAGWTTPPDFKVAALIRHPVDRVLSAFRYIHKVRKDLVPFASTPEIFLDNFLSKDEKNCLIFDNHNKSLIEFLANDQGEVDPQIYIQPLSNIKGWIETLGLPICISNLRRNTTENMKNSAFFSYAQIKRIKNFYSEDIIWFERFSL